MKLIINMAVALVVSIIIQNVMCHFINDILTAQSPINFVSRWWDSIPFNYSTKPLQLQSVQLHLLSSLAGGIVWFSRVWLQLAYRWNQEKGDSLLLLIHLTQNLLDLSIWLTTFLIQTRPPRCCIARGYPKIRTLRSFVMLYTLEAFTQQNLFSRVENKFGGSGTMITPLYMCTIPWELIIYFAFTPFCSFFQDPHPVRNPS